MLYLHVCCFKDKVARVHPCFCQVSTRCEPDAVHLRWPATSQFDLTRVPIFEIRLLPPATSLPTILQLRALLALDTGMKTNMEHLLFPWACMYKSWFTTVK